MNEISISADAFKAYSNELIQKTVKETLRQLRTEAVTKSEYSRLYHVSRVTVNRMIARGELQVNKHGKIIIQ